MSKVLFLLSVLTHFPSVLSVTGVDVSSVVSVSEWSCLHKTQSIDFMITRAWHSTGTFDTNSITNLQNAQNGGIQYTNVYLFPCRGDSPSDQISSMISQLDSSNAIYGMIWLDIETNSDSDCTWNGYSQNDNCNYILTMANTGVNMGKSVGIYSGHNGWQSVFSGNYSACPQASIYPLWFAHYDNNQNFNDYPNYKIGGWNTPNIKQYLGTNTLCNASVDMDWYP